MNIKKKWLWSTKEMAGGYFTTAKEALEAGSKHGEVLRVIEIDFPYSSLVFIPAGVL